MKNFLARAVVLAGVLLWAGAACGPAPQSLHRAALVVVHENGETITRCVTFSEPEISGFDLVDSTDLDLNYEPNAFGAAICRLDGEGCTYPNESCFCQCKSDFCVYWSYWRLVDGAWQYSNAGPANTRVQDGDVEGWVWGQGNFSTSADRQPPALAFSDICAAPTSAATPSMPTIVMARVAAQQQATPTTTATATSTPTATQTRPPSTSTFTPAPTFTGTLVPTPTTTQTPIPQPVIVRFGVDRPTVNYSETVTLAWEVINATAILLRYPGVEETVQASGSKQMLAERSLQFFLIATNSVGEARAEASLTVNPVFSQPTAQTTDTPSPAPTITQTVTLPPSETPTVPPTPTDTATAPPTSTSTSTMTPTTAPTLTPVPTDTATIMATETPTGTPIPAATATPVLAPAAPVSDTGVLAPVAPTPDPNVQPVRLAPPADLESERVQRLLLIGGIVFVLAAPLLFAAIWFVVWSFWREP
jgi:hypothetical protein